MNLKLNYDCIRDLLLFIEGKLQYGFYIDVDSIQIKNYSQQEILYSADKLYEAGYISADKRIAIGGKGIPQINIKSITWDGHQFLDNVRDNKVWENTKSILSNFSSVSIGIVNNVATQIISSVIETQLGLK